MLDDADCFVTLTEQKADFELAMWRGYIEDILTGSVWFADIKSLGRLGFIKAQLQKWSSGLDTALHQMVWNA